MYEQLLSPPDVVADVEIYKNRYPTKTLSMSLSIHLYECLNIFLVRGATISKSPAQSPDQAGRGYAPKA